MDIGNGCNEDALNSAKQIEDDWLPGMLYGKPVTVEFDLPLSFHYQTTNFGVLKKSLIPKSISQP